MTLLEQAIAFRRLIVKAASTQTDKDALESVDLYDTWESKLPKEGQQQGEEVVIGERLRHAGKLWKTLQKHKVQADWEPGKVPAVFTEVSDDEWPEIPENIPAENPWMKGQKGTWKGAHKICQMDNCVWNPDQYPAAWEDAE